MLLSIHSAILHRPKHTLFAARGWPTVVNGLRTIAISMLFTALATADRFDTTCLSYTAALDDVDGDAFPDFVVGSPESLDGQGQLWVISGATGAVLAHHLGTKGETRFGQCMAKLRDINRAQGSEILVVSDLTGTEPAKVVRIYPVLGGDCLGRTVIPGEGWVHSLGGAGDCNADGIEDFYVGVPRVRSPIFQAGAVRFYSGQDQQLLGQIQGTGAEQHFGDLVTPCGDLDGDGCTELAVSGMAAGQGGDRTPDSLRVPERDHVAIVSSKKSTVLRYLEAPEAGMRFGWATCRIGDLNGDGQADLAVSAPGAQEGLWEPDGGAVYLYSLTDGALLRKVANESRGCFGASLAYIPSTTTAGSLLVGATYEDGSSGLVFDVPLPTGAIKVAARGQLRQCKAGVALHALIPSEADPARLPRILVGLCDEAVMIGRRPERVISMVEHGTRLRCGELRYGSEVRFVPPKSRATPAEPK